MCLIVEPALFGPKLLSKFKITAEILPNCDRCLSKSAVWILEDKFSSGDNQHLHVTKFLSTTAGWEAMTDKVPRCQV